MKKLCAAMLAVLLLFSLSLPASAEKLSRKQLMSYYNGALMVGDSITRQMQFYVKQQQQKDKNFFPGLTFLAADSYSLYAGSRRNAMSNGAVLTYRGQKTSLFYALSQMQPTRVIILLGVNDYIGKEIDKGLSYDRRIVTLAKEASPATQVIFESLTPVTRHFCRNRDYRTLWDKYNKKLKALCKELNVGYMDIATGLKDKEGYLPDELSRDGEYHLSTKGLEIWVQAMLDYAQAQYDQGLWKPGKKK